MRLKPDYNVVSLFDVDFENLKKQGINTILFDLDSTLMPSKSGVYPEKVLNLLNELRQDFLVAVISNNKNQDYISKVQSQSFFPVIGHANKPSPKIMQKFLIEMGRIPSETVMIGDRPLTDILAGKLLGTRTVLVDSITKDSEGLPTRFVRALERISIKK